MSDGEQNGNTCSITVGEGAGTVICGEPQPGGGGALLCAFGPDHGDGHSWEQAGTRMP